ncbi:hypothetical protein [Streptomyces yangpuensis]|uniref:hypothetical protein n=1 Tax=Streptomyces yangpuensis TaxID=1648182 RepID=UPI00365A8E9C
MRTRAMTTSAATGAYHQRRSRPVLTPAAVPARAISSTASPSPAISRAVPVTVLSQGPSDSVSSALSTKNPASTCSPTSTVAHAPVTT